MYLQHTYRVQFRRNVSPHARWQKKALQSGVYLLTKKAIARTKNENEEHLHALRQPKYGRQALVVPAATAEYNA